MFKTVTKVFSAEENYRDTLFSDIFGTYAFIKKFKNCMYENSQSFLLWRLDGLH